ncbi:MAG: fatty acid desaturase family protein [Lentimonas sp.]
MRTGKALILATKEFANDNTAKSWWAIISTFVLLALTAGGTLHNIHWSAQFVCSILLGLLMVRLFVIYHDHQHNAILTKSKAAKVFMQIWGVIAITPTSIWTHSHNHHHNHNSKLRSAHIGSYPVMTKERYLRASKKEQAQYLAMRHPLTIIFGYFTIFLVGMCIVPGLSDTKDHKDSLIALILHIALYVVIITFFGWFTAIFAVLIPYFVACAMGSYLFYAQHNFPAVVFKENDGWTYEGAALESSSFCKMSPIMHYFTGNIGYHHIHHLNSKIPFYRLPEVYKKMPELQNAKTTTLNPLEVLRCLSLKIWDSDQQKLVPLKDIAV